MRGIGMSPWRPIEPGPAAVPVDAMPEHRREAGGPANPPLRAKVDEFFRQYHVALIKFFSARLRSTQEAKDVAQETYEWLLQHEDDPRVVKWIGPINPLVYRVAWHIAGNRMAKRQRHTRLDRQIFDTATPLAAAPEQLCAAHEDLAIIEECLKELPPRCRMVFVLARLEGLSFEEIAERMDISVRSVYRYVERALDHCMQRLDEGEHARAKQHAARNKTLKPGT